jgi:hypothetical protein
MTETKRELISGPEPDEKELAKLLAQDFLKWIKQNKINGGVENESKIFI